MSAAEKLLWETTWPIEVLALNGSLAAVTGSSTILLSIRRKSDDQFLDFDDDTFKSSGWTTREVVMSEVDATNSAGEYKYDFDTTAVTNEVADDLYVFRVRDSSATAKNMPQLGEIWSDGWVKDLLDEHGFTQADIAALDDIDIADVQTALTNQGYTTVRGPKLDNLDATVGSRATQAQILSDATPFPGANIDATISSRATQTSVDDIQNTTRFACTMPTLVVPSAGSQDYDIYVNLEDTNGDPEDPDAATITVGCTNQAGASRTANLDSTTMVQLSTGRYRVRYNVPAAHALEQLLFTFSYAENAVAFVKDKTTTVVDEILTGFTATDRANLVLVLGDTNETQTKLPTNFIMGSGVVADKDDEIDLILVDTVAIDGRLPADPADESLQQAAHTQTQADIAVLNDLSQADVQTALTAQGYTTVRAPFLDELDAPNLPADVDALTQVTIATTGTVAAGSTSTVVNSTISLPNDRPNNMQVLLTDGTVFVARNVNDYVNVSGAFTVDDLGFTPGIGTTIVLLARTGSVPLDLTPITDALNDIQGVGFDTATDSLEAVRNQGDAAWITATGFATPGDAMTLTAGALTAVAIEMWTTDISSNSSKLTEAAGMLNICRKAVTNRYTLTPGPSSGTFILLDDDDLSPIISQLINDAAGGGIASPLLSPARRAQNTI